MTLRAGIRKLSFWLAALIVGAAAMGLETEGRAQTETPEPAAPAAYLIADIQGSQTDDGFELRVRGSGPPTFTMYELYEPTRIVLDIAGGDFAESLDLPRTFPAGPVEAVRGEVLVEQQPTVGRLEVVLTREQSYEVNRQDKDIVIVLRDPVEEPGAADSPAGKETAAAGPPDPEDPGRSGIPGEEESEIDEPGGAVQFPGYDRQPITVDFYKIDLHNVFRLFGEISGMNIVVAEGVSGSLTLSLKNVPWDFVLDLILNMKDLQLEERYNTLVISPKSTQFTWPQRARQTVAITVEESAGPTETFKALTVKQQQEMSPAQIEAGKLIARGRSYEKEEEFEKALAGYEEAFALQPDNANLAMRLASLSLVRLGMNAKAVHYATSALRLDDTNHEAALYAAIGLANMNRTQAAKEYFDKAVSGDRPSGEALMNYAAFAEERKMHVNALLLLARHEKLYGDTLETMVARARIYDKEGNADKAVSEYRAILLSGFQLPPDLSRYIKGRLAAAQ